jgi:hypothetical protein
MVKRVENYQAMEYLCNLNCLVPRDVDRNWYLNNILYKMLDTVSSLKIINTFNKGEKVSLLEVILPEWDMVSD